MCVVCVVCIVYILCVVVRDLLQRTSRSRLPVAVIGTCQSQSDLHPCLSTAQGSQMFSLKVNIPLPDLSARADILHHLLAKRQATAEAGVIETVAAETEGCVARDLQCVVERGVVCALDRCHTR